MRPKLEYKTLRTEFFFADGSPMASKQVDAVVPSDAKTRKKATELEGKRSQPLRIASFEC
jgi:hypothetical protein